MGFIIECESKFLVPDGNGWMELGSKEEALTNMLDSFESAHRWRTANAMS